MTKLDPVEVLASSAPRLSSRPSRPTWPCSALRSTPASPAHRSPTRAAGAVGVAGPPP